MFSKNQNVSRSQSGSPAIDAGAAVKLGNYSAGERVLYLDVQVAAEQMGYKKMSVVEILQVAASESVEIRDEQASIGLLPTGPVIVGKTSSYSKDARKALSESILGLPTCSF